MKLSLVAFSFIASSALVYALPLHSEQPRANNATKPKVNGNRFKKSGKAAGAAFFLTNQPEGNFIVGSEIGQDGKLTLKDTVWAGGRGAHGNAKGPDPLFSQGAIKVAGKNVFTINAGSNTVTMFSMSRNSPARLRMVGQPVSSGGEFPISVAISKKSGQVCVLNGGKVNGVNCFKQDRKLGLIQQDNTQRSLNLQLSTPPSGPASSASHVIFNEDSSKLIAAIKGKPGAPGFLAIWDVDAKTGALSKDFKKMAPPSGGGLPFSMTVVPGKNAVLATDPATGFEVFDLQGKQSNAVPIQGQVATCWSSFSPKTGNFFLTDIGTSQVTEVHVDNNLKGSVVKQYPQGNGSSTIDNDVGTINGKDFMFVMAPGKKSVNVLRLDGPGNAQPVQVFNFENDAKKAGVKVDTDNLLGMTVFIK